MEDEVAPPSDADLVAQVRAGDAGAFAELWDRHGEAGRRAARRLTRRLDPDDLVQEAFTRILAAIRGGGGPRGDFRPYLYVAIHNVAVSWAGQARSTVDLDTLAQTLGGEDPGSAADDRTMLAEGFRSLSDDWRDVLWYTEVEQLPAAQVGPLMGLSPNAVAALAYRAREGLRQAWIRTHLATPEPDARDCRWTVDRIAAYHRGLLPPASASRVERHCTGCGPCASAALEGALAAERLRGLAPLLAPAATTVRGLLGTLLTAVRSTAAPVDRATAPPRSLGVMAAGAVTVVAGLIIVGPDLAPVEERAAVVVASPGRSDTLPSVIEPSTAASPSRPSRPTRPVPPAGTAEPVVVAAAGTPGGRDHRPVAPPPPTLPAPEVVEPAVEPPAPDDGSHDPGADPGTPGTRPAPPTEPGQPDRPCRPGQPDQPGQPDRPDRPGQPDTVPLALDPTGTAPPSA